MTDEQEPQDDAEIAVFSADLTGPTVDAGGGSIDQYVSEEEPDHDPFRDYPASLSTMDYMLIDSLVPAGATYRLAHNMDARRHDIWAAWGTSIVIGWIGDVSHQQEQSDHNPDSVGNVHAIDPMLRGTRAEKIVTAALEHPGDLEYIIHNGVIWSRSSGTLVKGSRGRKYTGSNPHRDHVHMSGRHGSAHYSPATGTGYDLSAEASTPTFNLLPTPPPPKPKPPAPTPSPSGHKPGTRQLYATTPTMKGEDVTYVQKFIGTRWCGVADGDFGTHTKAGVIRYQRMRGLKADGAVGPVTWHNMGVRYTGK